MLDRRNGSFADTVRDCVRWISERNGFTEASVPAIKKHKKEVADFNLLETRTALTYFVRGERFCDGHMASCIGNGCLLQWLSRYKELLEENV